jgi:hypothetical protein
VPNRPVGTWVGAWPGVELGAPWVGCLTVRPESVRDVESHSGTRGGNRYDDRMVLNDVSDKAPGVVLVARLHVDLCRLNSAIC